MPIVKNPTLKVARAQKKITVLMTELASARRELNSASRALAPRSTVNRQAAVRAYVANSNGAFTSRDVAKAIYPELQTITATQTTYVAERLRRLHQRDKSLYRVLSVDGKNSGQFVYFKANRVK